MKSVFMWAAAFTCALIVQGYASSASASQNVSRGAMEVSFDNGGNVVAYAREMTRARQQNTHVSFRGHCASACTIFLALPSSQTCIRPGTKFGFHKAYGASANSNKWGTQFLLDRYPTWVRAWIDSHGGLTSRMIWMDYAYASRHMPTCSKA